MSQKLSQHVLTLYLILHPTEKLLLSLFYRNIKNEAQKGLIIWLKSNNYSVENTEFVHIYLILKLVIFLGCSYCIGHIKKVLRAGASQPRSMLLRGQVRRLRTDLWR